MPTTTIQIELQVRDQLRARGRMGESYNDVIRRLLSATRATEASRDEGPLKPVPPASRPWNALEHRT